MDLDRDVPEEEFKRYLRNTSLEDMPASVIKRLNVPTLEKPYTKILEQLDLGHGLDMTVFHNTCRTAHCIAGWIVVLTPGGRDLEAKLCATDEAATLILRASGSPIPDFYCEDEEGLQAVRELAELEISL